MLKIIGQFIFTVVQLKKAFAKGEKMMLHKIVFGLLITTFFWPTGTAWSRVLQTDKIVVEFELVDRSKREASFDLSIGDDQFKTSLRGGQTKQLGFIERLEGVMDIGAEITESAAGAHDFVDCGRVLIDDSVLGIFVIYQISGHTCKTSVLRRSLKRK